VSLRMTKPTRNSRTGMYEIRKRVPDALYPLVRTGEIKRSLRTKDPQEAKRRAPAVLQAIDAILDQARLGLRCSQDDLEGLAGAYFRKRSAELLNQAQNEAWEDTVFEGAAASHEAVLDAPQPTVPIPDGDTTERSNPAEEAAAVEGMSQAAAQVTEEHGFFLRPELQRQLALLLYRAEGQAISAAEAKYRCLSHYDEPGYPELRPPEVRSLPRLFQAYATYQDFPSGTRKEWAARIDHFHAFLESKAPYRITRQDVRRYAEHLRDVGGRARKPLTDKGLNQGYLATIRAVFNWAVANDYLSSNPAEKVTIKMRANNRTTPKRGYSDEQISGILTAAREESTPFKRWVPWLCALTGARVSEILNARKSHIGQTKGIWYLEIREDTQKETDGTEHRSRLKTPGSARYIPLHSALIDEGFLDYLASVPDDDYLFPGKWSDQHGNRTKGPANQLRLWIHKIVPKSDGLSPTHSFRHWFISQARAVDMDADIRRQITGHKDIDVHGRYGPADIPHLAGALGRIPSPVSPLPAE